MHHYFLYLGSIWALISLGLLFIAWRTARKKEFLLHRKIMIFLTAAAWAFMLLYLLRYKFPESLPTIPPEYIPWIALHGTVALFPLIGATLLVISRWKEKRHPQGHFHFNRHHKVYGRVLMLLWSFTHVGGIVNAYLFS